MRKYEVIFIVRPDASEEDVDKLIAQMEGSVSGTGGQIEKVDKIGRRRLAYRVRGYREGLYTLFTLEGSGDTVKELERRLKVNDAVIKFLSVCVDQDMKRMEKFKTLRARQAARKPKSPAPSQGVDAQPVALKE